MARLTHKEVDDEVRKILTPEKDNGGSARELLQKLLGMRKGMSDSGR